MKKIGVFIFLCCIVSLSAVAQQAGDVYIGLKGGYISSYKEAMAGFRTSYNLTDPFEISLSLFMNPKIKQTEGEGDYKLSSETKLYTFNLNMHYYVMLQETWAMGPTLGGQYFMAEQSYKEKEALNEKDNCWGLNVGWHLRYDVANHWTVNGGWKYSAVTDDNSYHSFYLGLGYRFNLF